MNIDENVEITKKLLAKYNQTNDNEWFKMIIHMHVDRYTHVCLSFTPQHGVPEATPIPFFPPTKEFNFTNALIDTYEYYFRKSKLDTRPKKPKDNQDGQSTIR